MPWYSQSSAAHHQQIHLHVVASPEAAAIGNGGQPPSPSPPSPLQQQQPPGNLPQAGGVGNGSGNQHQAEPGDPPQNLNGGFSVNVIIVLYNLMYEYVQRVAEQNGHVANNGGERVGAADAVGPIELVIAAEPADAKAAETATRWIKKPGLARRLSLKPVLEEDMPRPNAGRRMSVPGICTYA